MSPPLRNGLFVNFQDDNRNQADSLWYLQNQNALLPDPYYEMALWLSQISLAHHSDQSNRYIQRTHSRQK